MDNQSFLDKDLLGMVIFQPAMLDYQRVTIISEHQPEDYSYWFYSFAHVSFGHLRDRTISPMPQGGAYGEAKPNDRSGRVNGTAMVHYLPDPS